MKRELDPGQSTFEKSEWKKLIFARTDTLGINGQKDFRRVKGESFGEYEDRAKDEILSHKILHLAVCLNPRYSAWFIENEGDLFSHRFIKAKWNEKIAILDFLYSSPDLAKNWMEFDELTSFLKEDVMNKVRVIVPRRQRKRSARGTVIKIDDILGNSKIVAINYKYVPFLLKHRRVVIYRGWGIDSIERFSASIKHRFEKLLNAELNESAAKLENSTTQLRKVVEEMTNLLSGLIKPQTRGFGLSDFTIDGDFDAHLSIYPPCIRDLITTVEKVGYIPHWERFQLGLFLKKTGMQVEDQLQYWYSKAVDNIGLSYDEFVKRAGYVIRHIYGIEGGKIDYEMPSCTTIQTKMYCTFRHSGIGIIEENLKLLAEKDENFTKENTAEKIQKVVELTSRGFPNQACAAHLSLYKSHKLPQIKHPMIYLKIAGEGSGVLRENSDDDLAQAPKVED